MEASYTSLILWSTHLYGCTAPGLITCIPTKGVSYLEELVNSGQIEFLHTVDVNEIPIQQEQAVSKCLHGVCVCVMLII